MDTYVPKKKKKIARTPMNDWWPTVQEDTQFTYKLDFDVSVDYVDAQNLGIDLQAHLKRQRLKKAYS